MDTPLGTGERRRTQAHAALRIVAQRCGGGYGSPRVSVQRARARINTTHTRARVLHQDISYQQIIRSDLRSDLDHEIRPTSRNRTLVQKSDVHREIGPPSEIGVPSKSDPKSVPTPKSSRPEPPTQGLVGFGPFGSLFGTPFWAPFGPPRRVVHATRRPFRYPAARRLSEWVPFWRGPFWGHPASGSGAD